MREYVDKELADVLTYLYHLISGESVLWVCWIKAVVPLFAETIMGDCPRASVGRPVTVCDSAGWVNLISNFVHSGLKGTSKALLLLIGLCILGTRGAAGRRTFLQLALFPSLKHGIM